MTVRIKCPKYDVFSGQNMAHSGAARLRAHQSLVWPFFTAFGLNWPSESVKMAKHEQKAE
jgi:hypothetical protein